jgi:predicted amidophosphoribosyltransferase
MGKLAAAELYKEDFFEGIDLIIPVPLHPGRQRRRGYNQAECIARGIASVAQIPWTAVRWYGNGRQNTRHIRMCSSGGQTYRIFFT